MWASPAVPLPSPDISCPQLFLESQEGMNPQCLCLPSASPSTTVLEPQSESPCPRTAVRTSEFFIAIVLQLAHRDTHLTSSGPQFRLYFANIGQGRGAVPGNGVPAQGCLHSHRNPYTLEPLPTTPDPATSQALVLGNGYGLPCERGPPSNSNQQS